MLKFKVKKMLGKNFKTYEDALEATKEYGATLNTRDIEVKMDLEDFYQIKYEAEKKIEEEKERANSKIQEAEQKQKEITKKAEEQMTEVKKNVDNIKKKIEQEKKEKEKILKTLRKVRKGKNLKPQETQKAVMFKCEYSPKDGKKTEKFLIHSILPIPPEPELYKEAWNWLERENRSQYVEKLYFHTGVGWISISRVKWEV